METGVFEHIRTNVSDIADMQRQICDYENGINAIMLYLSCNRIVSLKSNIKEIDNIINKIVDMKSELTELRKLKQE